MRLLALLLLPAVLRPWEHVAAGPAAAAVGVVEFHVGEERCVLKQTMWGQARLSETHEDTSCKRCTRTRR